LKINRLDDLQVFVCAAEVGSFTEVAHRLGLTPALVSAIIKRLENGTGVRLFERPTRRVRLSEAGERLLGPAREALQALSQCESAIDGAADPEGRLSGSLRMSLPGDIGRQHLLQWIGQFLDTQPEGAAVSLEMRVSDRVAHLLEQPVDLALRYGEPDDSDHIALPLAPQNARVLVASPDYLARHPQPRTVAELRDHPCLRYVVGETLYSRWRLVNAAGEERIQEVQGPFSADDGGVVRQWAIDGRGIAYKSALDVAEDLAQGRLVRLLPEWAEPTPLHMLVVSRARLSPALRRLAAWLAQRCTALLADCAPALGPLPGDPPAGRA
jgi:DNA-binding transcriptional LysR family regulator